MKLNIANPSTGTQKTIEFEEERKVAFLMEKRLAYEFEGSALGDEFKGYIFKITGGHDKQGFAMKQGVLVNGRVRLLLARGTLGFQKWRGRSGERRRKSVRGCIIGQDIAVLHLVVLKKGEAEIPGLTDTTVPRRLGPKRASKIRKLFNLTKDDDVRKHVIRRKIEKKGKTYYKAPKIQRLVTPIRLQRKRMYKLHQRQAREKSKSEAEAYKALLDSRRADKKRKTEKVAVPPAKEAKTTPTPAAPAVVPAAKPAKTATKTASAVTTATAAVAAKKSAAPAPAPVAAPAKTATKTTKAAAPTTTSKPTTQPTKTKGAQAQPKKSAK